MCALFKPSTVTNQTGAYSYKGGLSSSAQNYIDNNFPYLMAVNTSNIITGELEIASTGTFIAINGSTFTVETPANFTNSLTVAGTTILEGNVTCEDPVSMQSTLVVEGNFTCDSTITIPSGGMLLVDSGSTFTSNTVATFTDGLAVTAGDTTLLGVLGVASVQGTVVNTTINLTGTTTLTAGDYSQLTISLNSGGSSLTGTCDIVFPNNVGQVWFVDLAQVIVYGNSQTVRFNCGGASINVLVTGTMVKGSGNTLVMAMVSASNIMSVG